VDKSFSGTLPQWQFLADFQRVTERKKKKPTNRSLSLPTLCKRLQLLSVVL
jgi:hypothetical protein